MIRFSQAETTLQHMTWVRLGVIYGVRGYIGVKESYTGYRGLYRVRYQGYIGIVGIM